MISPNQAEQLLMPLMVRAHASKQTGFVDQAAQYLVQKLELQRPAWTAHFPARHCLEVQRCQWIDQQVLAFLKKYPDAMGIEMGAGLSTRFQRLSAQVDWPRFRWVDIDTDDVIDCADLIFPRTDNYRLVACNLWHEDWLAKSRWQPGTPLMVVIETLAQPDDISSLQNMLTVLNEAAKNSPAPIHVVLDYASPLLQRIRRQMKCMLYGRSCCGFADANDLLKRLNLHGRLMSETDLAVATKGPFFQRFLAKLYRRLTQKCFWGAIHVELLGHATT